MRARRPDGTTIVTSGDEVSESVVEIPERPDDEGWYLSIDKVVRSYGRPDRGGSSTPAGSVSTTWMRFDPSGDRMIVCRERSLEACFGPLVRVSPQQRP